MIQVETITVSETHAPHKPLTEQESPGYLGWIPTRKRRSRVVVELIVDDDEYEAFRRGLHALETR